MDNRKDTVVHLITPYLFHTGSWIYSQLSGMKHYRTVVFTQKKENAGKFPVDELYSADDFWMVKRNINKVYRRIFDEYGLFFDPIVTKNKPRISHAHFGFEGVRWLPLVQRHRLPLVTTFYGIDASKLGKIKSWRDRYVKLFEYGRIFLAEGSFLKKQLVDLGCPDAKVIVQHLGVDPKNYPHKKHGDSNRRRIVILQVSSFREKKGIEYSLDAIAKLRQSNVNVEFRVIGSGDDEPAIKKINSIVDTLDLRDCVSLLGAKEHGETIREMLGADIFLHPSVTAADGDNEGGAPVGIIEASAVGLPIVSTLHADIPEVVLDGATGFLAAERNSTQLAEKLATLCADVEMRRAFGESGREHVALHYNVRIQVPKLEAIYERCFD